MKAEIHFRGQTENFGQNHFPENNVFRDSQTHAFSRNWFLKLVWSRFKRSLNIPSSCTQIGKNPKASRGEKEKNKMIKWEDERAEMPEYWTWRDWPVIQQVLDNWIIRLQMVLPGDSNTLKFNSNTNPELISGKMGVARRQQFISYTRATVTGLRFKTLQ